MAPTLDRLRPSVVRSFNMLWSLVCGVGLVWSLRGKDDKHATCAPKVELISKEGLFKRYSVDMSELGAEILNQYSAIYEIPPTTQNAKLHKDYGTLQALRLRDCQAEGNYTYGSEKIIILTGGKASHSLLDSVARVIFRCIATRDYPAYAFEPGLSFDDSYRKLVDHDRSRKAPLPKEQRKHFSKRDGTWYLKQKRPRHDHDGTWFLRQLATNLFLLKMLKLKNRYYYDIMFRRFVISDLRRRDLFERSPRGETSEDNKAALKTIEFFYDQITTFAAGMYNLFRIQDAASNIAPFPKELLYDSTWMSWTPIVPGLTAKLQERRFPLFVNKAEFIEQHLNPADEQQFPNSVLGGLFFINVVEKTGFGRSLFRNVDESGEESESGVRAADMRYRNFLRRLLRFMSGSAPLLQYRLEEALPTEKNTDGKIVSKFGYAADLQSAFYDNPGQIERPLAVDGNGVATYVLGKRAAYVKDWLLKTWSDVSKQEHFYEEAKRACRSFPRLYRSHSEMSLVPLKEYHEEEVDKMEHMLLHQSHYLGHMRATIRFNHTTPLYTPGLPDGSPMVRQFMFEVFGASSQRGQTAKPDRVPYQCGPGYDFATITYLMRHQPADRVAGVPESYYRRHPVYNYELVQLPPERVNAVTEVLLDIFIWMQHTFASDGMFSADDAAFGGFDQSVYRWRLSNWWYAKLEEPKFQNGKRIQVEDKDFNSIFYRDADERKVLQLDSINFPDKWKEASCRTFDPNRVFRGVQTNGLSDAFEGHFSNFC
eukprot:TRINITY_DN6909_c0_g1_i3.p1 TRINITY_DN6909_c0_g1~~TRINITY_DN6909_c0_g1_i3.p1  ORF type:complete len:778 (+),score=50.46 TRINITY_DN6909_c0_g1_i3:42-2336(+)